MRVLLKELLSFLFEDTELTSLVVKTDSEQRANSIVQHLKKYNIDARSKYPAEFDPFDRTEQDGWGVFVKPMDVKPAAKQLSNVSKGLQFDPYARSR